MGEDNVDSAPMRLPGLVVPLHHSFLLCCSRCLMWKAPVADWKGTPLVADQPQTEHEWFLAVSWADIL